LIILLLLFVCFQGQCPYVPSLHFYLLYSVTFSRSLFAFLYCKLRFQLRVLIPFSLMFVFRFSNFFQNPSLYLPHCRLLWGALIWFFCFCWLFSFFFFVLSFFFFVLNVACRFFIYGPVWAHLFSHSVYFTSSSLVLILFFNFLALLQIYVFLFLCSRCLLYFCYCPFYSLLLAFLSCFILSAIYCLICLLCVVFIFSMFRHFFYCGYWTFHFRYFLFCSLSIE